MSPTIEDSVSAARRRAAAWAVPIAVVVMLGSCSTSNAPAATGEVSAARFALVEDGMSPTEVESIIGRPMTTIVNPAEGMQGEPPATCWKFTSDERGRVFSVCFVDGIVVTRSSYVEGSGSP